MAWNDGLDQEFIDIAGYRGEYLCVIAGAGTGKSYALKRKVARLLEEGMSPGCLLVVTFTRTAARDLRNDLLSLEVEGCDLVRACTLHSLCYSILNKHEVFTVMQRETRTLLAHEEDYLIADLSARLGRIRSLKERMRAFKAAWARLLTEEPGWPPTEEDRSFDHELRAWLRFHKAMLVGELVPLTIEYLRNNPASPERSAYRHIIVDEYQDLNKSEQRLVRLLSQDELPEGRTLTVAGDDDQSIFVSLKYAHPEGILNFKDEYPDTYERTLQTCRRCPRRVIELANAFLVATGQKDEPKLLQPMANAADGEVAIVQWRTLIEEADGIARIVEKRVSSGDVNPGEILVLTPRKEIGHQIVNNLLAHGIEAKTGFAETVLASRTAQESYAFLTLMHNGDDAVSLRVLLGISGSEKGKRPYERIRKQCHESGDSIMRTLTKLEAGELRIAHTDSMVQTYRGIAQRLEHVSSLPLEDAVDELSPPGVEDIAELRKLALEALEEADDVHGLCDELNAAITQPEPPEDADAVLVLTLHKAKGLTAKMVLVVNCLDGCIPHTGFRGRDEEDDEAMAEQERLFFVALTRTTNMLVISSTAIMRGGDAARLLGETGGGRYWSDTLASRFIPMLGPSAPEPQMGARYLAAI